VSSRPNPRELPVINHVLLTRTLLSKQPVAYRGSKAHHPTEVNNRLVAKLG